MTEYNMNQNWQLHHDRQKMFMHDTPMDIEAAINANLITTKPECYTDNRKRRCLYTTTTATTTTNVENCNENEKENHKIKENSETQENQNNNNNNQSIFNGSAIVSTHYYTTTGERRSYHYYFHHSNKEPTIVTTTLTRLTKNKSMNNAQKQQQQHQQQNNNNNNNDNDNYYKNQSNNNSELNQRNILRSAIKRAFTTPNTTTTTTTTTKDYDNSGPTAAKRSNIPNDADTATNTNTTTNKRRYIDVLMFQAIRQKLLMTPAGTYFDVISITTENAGRTIVSQNSENIARLRIYHHCWDGYTVRFVPPKLITMVQQRFLISYAQVTSTNSRVEMNRPNRRFNASEAPSIFVFSGQQQQQQQQQPQQQEPPAPAPAPPSPPPPLPPQQQQQQEQEQPASSNQESRVDATNPPTGTYRYVTRNFENRGAYRAAINNLRLRSGPNSIYRHVMEMNAMSVHCFDIYSEREYAMKVVNESMDRVKQAYFKLELDKEHLRSNSYGHALVRSAIAVLPCVTSNGDINHQRCFIVINPKTNSSEEISMWTDSNTVGAAFEDLHSYIRRKRRLSEAEARGLFMQICETVRVCHRNGIILRDLKLKRFFFIDQER